LVPADGPVRLECLAAACAKCCRLLGSPIVTDREAEHFDSDVLHRTAGGTFIRSDRGCCRLLRDGLCSAYEVRPQGCREYPWYNIDGTLYYDAGCPGIRHDRDERPPVERIGPFDRFFPGCPPWLVRLVRRLCVRQGRS